MTAISAVGVGYSAGRAVIVSDIHLEVAAGEILAIIGPNGAGKSTLLGLLGGDLGPTDGDVSMAGKSISAADEPELALMRSMLGQRGAADVPFTVHEVVSMGRHPLRRRAGNSAARDNEAVATSLARTDMTALAERVFSTLSGGEQARASIARVLAQEAPIVLLDEPTSALDVSHEERIMGELRREAASGTAVVAVLHDLNAAARHASRIVAMSGGRIVSDGAPEEVLTDGLLSEIYGQPMRVVPHPFRDCPLVLVADQPN